MRKSETDVVWENLFDKYPIEKGISDIGYYEISADKIKEFKEPRLVTKFDCQNGLPQIMKDKNINILPNTRGTYILGNFNMFKALPDDKDVPIQYLSFPNWIKSIDVKNIQSESVAISTALITPIFEDFLEDNELISTVSGRMKSGVFDFQIGNSTISVTNSQIEIDGALESPNQFVLIEGKNILHNDFNIRQLYYPYRRYKAEIPSKPIKNIYLEYSNNTYRLLEYEFSDFNKYDSCNFVKQKKYRIDVEKVSFQELLDTFKSVTPNLETYNAPFIQCDKFDKILNILENLVSLETIDEMCIYSYFDFKPRQANYYYNGCRFLGLVYKDSSSKIHLTDDGKRVMALNYKDRQLALFKRIISHKVLYDTFEYYLKNGVLDRNYAKQKMKDYAVCNEDVIDRRSRSVISWLDFMLMQTK